jgi:AraC-like DNA-binding protein
MSAFVFERLRAIGPVIRALATARGRQRLHVMPTTAGYETQTSSRYDWSGLQRGAKPFTVLQHTTSGAGWLRFERQRLRIKPGETFVVTVPHDHRYWVEDGGHWEFFWISMSGQEALRVHRNVLAESGPVLRLPQATIDHLAACCLRLVEMVEPTPGAASALAYEALMALHEGAAGDADQDPADRLARALTLMRGGAQSRASVAALAKAAGYTRAHFSRTFQARMGEPPAAFQRQERLLRAAKALADDPRMTIKQASSAAGFNDQSQFAKAFRKLIGKSPSAYRSGRG